MMNTIKQLWPLKRSLISDDYDKALFYLAKKYPLKTIEFPSGTECWTWIIPEKWTCHEAYLETLSGQRLIDYKDHPLHCVEYSAPFENIVSRDELLQHLYVHPKNPLAIPYIFKFYERTWGLCCSQKQKDNLNDVAYRVVIKTRFEPGNLKIGEWWIPGQTGQIFVLTAHLCHPCMANDDLSGVVVALDVMDRLSKIDNLYYTYVLLLVPETIGSIAWLSHHEELIPKMKGGLFLEMLGNDSSLALQRSYFGNTQIDLCCEHIIKEREKDSYIRDFWTIIRNDELEYNSPGVRVPMPSISRCLKPESEFWPYPEYHTHFDTPEIIREERLVQAADTVLKILTTFDHNVYPKAEFKGQVFCSRYNIFPKNSKEYEIFFKTLFELDGNHSIMDIAQKHEIYFSDVLDVVNSLSSHRLVSLIRK